MKYAFSTFFTQKAGKEEKAEKLKIHLALKIFFLVCSQTLDGVIWTQYFKYSGCLFANTFLCMSVCLSACFRSDNCFLYKLSNLGDLFHRSWNLLQTGLVIFSDYSDWIFCRVHHPRCCLHFWRDITLVWPNNLDPGCPCFLRIVYLPFSSVIQ